MSTLTKVTVEVMISSTRKLNSEELETLRSNMFDNMSYLRDHGMLTDEVDAEDNEVSLERFEVDVNSIPSEPRFGDVHWNEVQQEGVLQAVKENQLVSVVDESRGIIAYAIGEDNADQIIKALNKVVF